MKNLFKTIFDFFNPDSKEDYIGLSHIKVSKENKSPAIKKETKKVETTTLTGLLKRAS